MPERPNLYFVSLEVSGPYDTYTLAVIAPNEETAEYLAVEKIKQGHATTPKILLIRSRDDFDPAKVGVVWTIFTGE